MRRQLVARGECGHTADAKLHTPEPIFGRVLVGRSPCARCQRGRAGKNVQPGPDDIRRRRGVRPNALYNHIHSLDELLNAVIERFVSSLQLPAGGQPWPDWVRAVAAELRSQLIEHPGLTELVLARAGATATGPTVLTRFLDELVAQGVDRAVAHVAWHALLTVVVGSLEPERARGTEGELTFHTVLDLTITGLLATAREPPSPQAIAMLDAHVRTDSHPLASDES